VFRIWGGIKFKSASRHWGGGVAGFGGNSRKKEGDVEINNEPFSSEKISLALKLSEWDGEGPSGNGKHEAVRGSVMVTN